MIEHSFQAPLSAEALAFLSRATGIDFMGQDTSSWLCVSGREEGRLLGVAVFMPQNWFDWHFSCAIDDPRVMSRRLLRAMFAAVFSQAVRVTALVEPTNKRALGQVKRMGFVYEGFLRLGVEGRRDAMIFGMLRADCRFLPGYNGGTVIPLTFGRDLMVSSPKPPNPYQTASAQQGAESGAAQQASIINNPNEYSNYGSQVYSIAGWEPTQDASGKTIYTPRYNKTTTLSPRRTENSQLRHRHPLQRRSDGARRQLSHAGLFCLGRRHQGLDAMGDGSRVLGSTDRPTIEKNIMEILRAGDRSAPEGRAGIDGQSRA